MPLQYTFPLQLGIPVVCPLVIPKRGTVSVEDSSVLNAVCPLVIPRGVPVEDSFVCPQRNLSSERGARRRLVCPSHRLSFLHVVCCLVTLRRVSEENLSFTTVSIKFGCFRDPDINLIHLHSFTT